MNGFDEKAVFASAQPESSRKTKEGLISAKGSRDRRNQSAKGSYKPFDKASNMTNIVSSHLLSMVTTAIMTAALLLRTTVVASMATRLYDFTPAQIQAVLREHNYLRSIEPAAYMQELIWDEHLASIAKDWASRCSAEHRSLWQRQRLSQYHVIGENIWWSNERYLRADMGSVIRDFHSEKVYYNYHPHSCLRGRQCGHYIQVVWANTCAVGCAAAFCPYIRRGRGIRTGNMIVCNYGPGGNVIGVRPYSWGRPCSTCPFTCRNGLCPSKCLAFQKQQKIVQKPRKKVVPVYRRAPMVTRPPDTYWNSSTTSSGTTAPSNADLQRVVSSSPQLPTTPYLKATEAEDLQHLSRRAEVKPKINERKCRRPDCVTWIQKGQCQVNQALMSLLCRGWCENSSSMGERRKQHTFSQHPLVSSNPDQPRTRTNQIIPSHQSESTNGNSSCIDKHPLCSQWARWRHCELNPIYMLKWCQRSCRSPECFRSMSTGAKVGLP
ncbi:ShK and CAP domain containing protein [Trichuris trichiura]|uniref:ShK and CAP domain containing protein n=1 Tax=Trichuris trichiura TaxID=36087 RepID=A0A077YYJ9_TRITR|nr:ShK and CAP domain containing protein [Trichuris trichiura]